MPFKRLDRRTFLRSAGVAIGLPFLDAMVPASAAEAKAVLARPRRMVLVGRPLGLYAPYFFPEKAGKDYGMPWNVLAGIGHMETDHGRSTQPGTLSGENYAGAGGPAYSGE